MAKRKDRFVVGWERSGVVYGKDKENGDGDYIDPLIKEDAEKALKQLGKQTDNRIIYELVPFKKVRP